MHAQCTMLPRAVQADEAAIRDAGPLGIGGRAVGADPVARQLPQATFRCGIHRVRHRIVLELLLKGCVIVRGWSRKHELNKNEGSKSKRARLNARHIFRTIFFPFADPPRDMSHRSLHYC